jgi:hypothetical protein
MLRILKLNSVAIDATKTRCLECDFQHSEHSHCILFGLPLEQEWIPATVKHGSALNHLRLEVCKRTEKAHLRMNNDGNALPEDHVLSVTTEEQADAAGHGDAFRAVKDQR